MSIYTDLYTKAQSLCIAGGSPTHLRELGDKIFHANELLTKKICEGLAQRVEAAATVGSKQMDLFRFQGNELEELSGFPMLTLVKGPRDEQLRILSGPTLLQKLRAELAPFQVHHVWNSRTNSNRIILSWAEGLLSPATPLSLYPLPPPPHHLLA